MTDWESKKYSQSAVKMQSGAKIASLMMMTTMMGGETNDFR